MGLPILGLGSVCALGAGVESLRAGLSGDRSPEIEALTIDVPSGSVRLPVYRARLDGLEQFVQPRALRRLDRLSRMALYAAHLALEDADRPPADPARVGLVFGTGHGPQATTFAFQDGLLKAGDRFASPTLFSGSVHNSLASQVSIALNVEGPCQTVTCRGRTTAEVLAMARSWLVSGAVDQVIAGVGDELSPLLAYTVACAGERNSPALDPLNLEECSFAPGEGFVCWLLGSEPASAQHGRIEMISVGRQVSIPSDAQEVFLAATGDRSCRAGYDRLMNSHPSATAHAHLYGSLPVGLGFEVALAALSPISPTSQGGGSIACAECASDGQLSCVVVAP